MIFYIDFLLKSDYNIIFDQKGLYYDKNKNI